MDLKIINIQSKDNVDTPETTINCLSVCSGILGIERGLTRIIPNLRTVCHVEIESFIIENLVAQMEAGLLVAAPIWSDIKTFDGRLFRDKIHIITAGYPCSPFSNAGIRNGKEDPRHLYPYIERTIDAIRPKICFFENVRGHVTIGLREVIESLELLGYRVHWGIFSAEETGASHKRERVFILAVRKDILENSNSKSDVYNERRIYRETPSTSFELADYYKSGLPITAFRKQRCFPKSFESFQRCEFSRVYSTIELAYSNNNGERTRPNNNDGESKEIEGEEQWQERNEIFRERSGAESSLIGSMGNANDSRSQGRNSEECGECTYEWIAGPNGPFAPARPGQPQHSWESPRTTKGQWQTKSGMGGRVYADTAELAWITLWNKF